MGVNRVGDFLSLLLTKETDPLSETLCLKEFKTMDKVQNNRYIYHNFQEQPILGSNKICSTSIPTSKILLHPCLSAYARRVKQTTLKGTRQPTTIKNVPRLKVTLGDFKGKKAL
jgi:hypothetical protein